MQRRAFLGAFILALSGCSERLPTDLVSPGPPSPTETEPGTATTTETPTASPTPTPTPTATEVPPTPTPTPTETATASPTQRETELSLSAQLAAEQITEARTLITETVTAYAAFAGGSSPSILDVDASTTRFRFASINGKISDANNALLDARDKGNRNQREQVTVLLDVVEFLRASGQVQERVVATYAAFTAARTALREENVDRARSQANVMVNERRQGRNRFQELSENTEEASMDATEALSRRTYRRKLDQFDRELSTVNQLTGPIDRFADGIQRLKDARRLERQENFNNADRAADDAEAIFEEVIAALDAVLAGAVAVAFEADIESLREYADEKRIEADDF